MFKIVDEIKGSNCSVRVFCPDVLAYFIRSRYRRTSAITAVLQRKYRQHRLNSLHLNLFKRTFHQRWARCWKFLWKIKKKFLLKKFPFYIFPSLKNLKDVTTIITLCWFDLLNVFNFRLNVYTRAHNQIVGTGFLKYYLKSDGFRDTDNKKKYKS